MRNTGNKVLSLMLTFLMMFSLFGLKPQTLAAAGDTINVTITETDTVADINTAIQHFIDDLETGGGGTLKVFGSKLNVDGLIQMNIPTGVTVQWEADIKNDPLYEYGLISINSKGTFGGIPNAGIFEFVGGNLVKNGEYGAVFEVISSTPLIISGGKITGERAVIVSDEDAGVVVNGGEILTSETAITVNKGSATIMGGSVKSTANYAIRLMEGSVKVLGGTVGIAKAIEVEDNPFVPNPIAYAAAYLKGTCNGSFSVIGNGMIVSIDKLEIPVSWHDSSLGITKKAGGQSAKWDTSNTQPVIDFVLNDGSCFTMTWGVLINDHFDKYTQTTLMIPPVNDAVGYDVYRSAKKNKGFAKVGTTDIEGFVDGRLIAGKTYYYKTKPLLLNKKGKVVAGKFSKVVKKSLPALPVVTTADVVVSSGGEGGLNFKWNKINEESAIQIYLATSNNKKTKWSKYLSSAEDFTLRKLTVGKKYYYKMRYVHYNGSTSYGPFSNVTSLILGDLSNLAGTDIYTDVSVSFPATAGAVDYQIYRSTQKNKGFVKVATVPVTTYDDFQLIAGKTYYYKVKPVTVVNGKQVVGKFGSIIPITCNALPKVDDVTATVTGRSIEFDWDNDHNMAAIEIWVATTNNKKTKWSKYLVSYGAFSLLNLVANKRYYYKIRYVYYNATTSYGAFTNVDSKVTGS